jgi:hypothetical protein
MVSEAQKYAAEDEKTRKKVGGVKDIKTESPENSWHEGGVMRSDALRPQPGGEGRTKRVLVCGKAVLQLCERRLRAYGTDH